MHRAAAAQADRFLRRGEWLNREFRHTQTLRDRTVGIVGLGRIGKAIARRLDASDLPVAYHGRNRQADVVYRYYPDLVAMARAVDVLLVITPGGAGTKHLINARVLEALGPSGILINVARGSVVDEAALIEALQKKKLYAAGLDVFADEPRVPVSVTLPKWSMPITRLWVRCDSMDRTDMMRWAIAASLSSPDLA